MHPDDAFAHERKGAEQGLNPMLGDWQHRFNFAPISYSAGAVKRAAFREAIQVDLKNRFFYSNEVRLEIVLRLDVQTVLETDETADVDNYAKAILDGLKGPNGILLDDTQVQALTISWLDSYGRDRASFEVSISGSSDGFLLKPLSFYEMSNGLWYPHGQRKWVDGRETEQSDRDKYIELHMLEIISAAEKETRHLLRKSGASRLKAYQRGMYLASSARGFHRSRIDAEFPMHSCRQWQAAFTNWCQDHVEEAAEIEQVLLELRESRSKLVEALAGQAPEGHGNSAT